MTAEIALQINGMTKNFGGLKAIDGVDLTIPKGDRRLLLGPNGAGKTTLFNLITGDLKPTAGSVQLFGRDITGLASHHCAPLGLARTYQIITLFPKNTLAENVVLSLLGISPLRWSPISRIKGRKEFEERARAALKQVGLDAKVQALIESIPRDITLILIEHDMDVALALADSITVMYHGRVICEGDRAQVVADPRVKEIYLAS